MDNQDRKKKKTLKDKVADFTIKKFRVPPHDIDAEIAVLGAMMLSADAVLRVIGLFSSSDTIKPKDDKKLQEDPSQIFYDGRHQEIYKSIVELNKYRITPDIISLTDHLKKMGTLESVGGTNYLAEINTSTPTYAYVEHHAKIVLEHYFKRCLIDVADEVLGNCYDETSDALEEVENAERKIFAIAEKRMTRSYKSLATLSKETMTMVEKMFSNDKTTDCVTTGFEELDNLLNGGFHKSDLIILAARPSMGKTAFALALTMNAARIGEVPVGFFTIEMTATQVTLRLLSSMEGFNAQRALRYKKQDEMHKFTSGLGKLATYPICFDDTPAISIMALRAKCRRMKAEHNIGLIVVDYLQLIRSSMKSESREREISIVSSTLKEIARELEVPVLALSQLNRSIEERIFTGSKVNAERTPILSDLRESGSIEQDADIVMFIHRPEAVLKNEANKEKIIEDNGWKNLAQIIVEKHRNGPTGIVDLNCWIEYSQFGGNREKKYANQYEYTNGQSNHATTIVNNAVNHNAVASEAIASLKQSETVEGDIPF